MLYYFFVFSCNYVKINLTLFLINLGSICLMLFLNFNMEEPRTMNIDFILFIESAMLMVKF